MATVNLAPGDHTIEWVLEGYDPINAVINISLEGVVSCVSVGVGNCVDFISIVGATITALLKSSTYDICNWILSVGGWDNLNWSDHILKSFYVYIGTPNYTIDYSPVTWNSVLGLYYYYIGLKDMGNNKTGCEFI